MVPVSAASGTMGTGWCCGHRSVCARNSISGRLCSAVRMLLWPCRTEPEEEEEAEEVKAGWSDLDMRVDLALYSKINVDKMGNLFKSTYRSLDDS